jgi:pimeloyl-ACP methyl ester carboxylesterase
MATASVLHVSGVDVHVEGDGAETIVMVHGWPDTYRLWERQVVALKDRYRCVRFTLPGFDREKPRKAYTLDELIAFMDEVIERVSPGRQVILLLHDWGCVFGYQYYLRNRGKVAKIIGVDVGDPSSALRVLTGREKLIAFAYQTWNALAWKIGGATGDSMMRAMARWGHAPSDPAHITSRMGYPYWMLWFGGADSYRRHGRRFEPECPMLFIYGRRKPLRFHSSAWAEKLAAQPGNQVAEFDTGHWVMSQQPERFNELVRRWLIGN